VMGSKLAYEYALEDLASLEEVDTDLLAEPLTDTWRTGVRLAIECLALLLPLWAGLWSAAVWWRFTNGLDTWKPDSVPDLWSEHLVFSLFGLYWCCQRMVRRRGRRFRLVRRLGDCLGPFLVVGGGYLVYVAISFVYLDVKVHEKFLGAMFIVGPLSWVFLWFVLPSNHEGQGEGFVDPHHFSGYRSASASEAVEVARANCRELKCEIDQRVNEVRP